VGRGYDGRVSSPIVRRLSQLVIALATALALLGVAIPLFLNPVWIGFEQDRARADLWTGYAPAEVHRVTDSLVHDLVFGPAAFDATDDAGRPVLEQRERSHLRDVRAVFADAVVVLVASVVIVAVGMLVARSAPWFWRGMRFGARGLAVVVVVLGVVSVVAFDAAFELFHRLFFAGGTYTFDPRTDRLVQLFPDAFWSETTLALGAVLLLLAFGADRLAATRLRAIAATTDRDALAPPSNALPVAR